MITSITIENFKSYKSATLELSPLTIMIGANASGKSNALEAIRIMSWLARGTRLDDLEKNLQSDDPTLCGRVPDLFRVKDKDACFGCGITDDEKWNQLTFGIGLDKKRLVLKCEQVADSENNYLYNLGLGPLPDTDEIWVEYRSFNDRPRTMIQLSNQQALFYQMEGSVRFHWEDEKAQKIIPEVAGKFREALRKIVFLDPRPSQMRYYVFANDLELKDDGSNLSSVLYSIWNNPDRLGEKAYKEHLLDFIKSLPEQNIIDIEFIITDRNDVMVRLVESFGNQHHTIDAPLLSDGTLRVLAVAAMVLTAPQGALVIIEEIDNGIHPSRAEQLIRNIIEVAELRNLRVLLTTHNPALLDALPDDRLGDVLCCYRDPDEGDSRIVQLRNLERYPELVAQGPLGELMTKGILDRYLKDKTSPEQRSQAALEWIDNLRNEAAG